MSANCPYCAPFDSGWGMSPEGYRQMKELHDAGHKISEEPELRLLLSDARLQLATRSSRAFMAEVLLDGMEQQLTLSNKAVVDLRDRNDQLVEAGRALLAENTRLEAQLQAARDALAAIEGETT